MSNTKHEDAIMKMGFRYFRDQILKMLGIDYTYVDVGPTELMELTIHSLFMDFTFLTTEDMYIHVEFQTTDAGVDDLKGTLCRIFSMIREFYPVMILDEATSSIDTRTEAIVQCGMDALMKGRTVFVIAHRLSTVKNSNVIIVLDHGRIIEKGSHEELIDKSGQYYQLYTGAFELE